MAIVSHPDLTMGKGHEGLAPDDPKKQAAERAVDVADVLISANNAASSERDMHDLVCLEDAARFIPYQRPARFARLVLDFTDRARPPRP